MGVIWSRAAEGALFNKHRVSNGQDGGAGERWVPNVNGTVFNASEHLRMVKMVIFFFYHNKKELPSRRSG